MTSAVTCPNIRQVENGKGRVRLAMFTREKVEDIVDYIQAKCDITYPSEGDEQVEICSTGIGSNKWKATFESKLSVK